MFGIGFDTPSIKDLEKIKKRLKEKDEYKLIFSEEDNIDYIKIIVNENGDILGVLNKKNLKYVIINSEDIDNIKIKIDKNIKIKYKTIGN